MRRFATFRRLALTAYVAFVASNQVLAQAPAAPVVETAAVSEAVAAYAERNGVPGGLVVITDGSDVVAVVFVASLAAVASVRMMARLRQGRAYKTAVAGIFSRRG